jgi:dCMP deaminase
LDTIEGETQIDYHESWDHRHYLREAYRVASKSPDPSTQCGALLVDITGKIVIRACNTPPIGVKWTIEQMKDRDWKLAHIGHAERNCIYSAAHVGLKTSHLVMYCPWFACIECAKAIIQSGIRYVYGHKWILEQTPDRWKPDIFDAHQMMKEAGVKFSFVDTKISHCSILFNKETISP